MKLLNVGYTEFSGLNITTEKGIPLSEYADYYEFVGAYGARYIVAVGLNGTTGASITMRVYIVYGGFKAVLINTTVLTEALMPFPKDFYGVTPELTAGMLGLFSSLKID